MIVVGSKLTTSQDFVESVVDLSLQVFNVTHKQVLSVIYIMTTATEKVTSLAM